VVVSRGAFADGAHLCGGGRTLTYIQSSELLLRRMAAVVFVALITLFGAMAVSSVVWIFTLGLFPQ